MRYARYYICFSLIFVIFTPSIFGVYQDTESLDSSSEMDDEELLFEEEVFSDETNQRNDTASDSFLSKVKLTLQHEVSVATLDDIKLITNASMLKASVDHLFLNRFFVRFDGRSGVYYDNDHRSQAEDEAMLFSADINEFYTEFGGDYITLSLGKKIVVWGEADTGVITDVISPRDFSDFVFIELEESRIGEILASLALYSDLGKFSVHVNPFPQSDKTPGSGTRYDKVGGAVKREEPDAFDTEVGGRWQKTFGSMDISVMAGSFITNGAILESISVSDKEIMTFKERYKRFEMIGMAASLVKRNFLFKLEGAYKKEVPLQAFHGTRGLYPADFNVVDIAGGGEYDANGTYQMSLELSHRHIFDHHNSLQYNKKNHTRLYYTLSKNFLNDTLKPSYILFYDINFKDSFHQFKVTCDLSDHIQLDFGYTHFEFNNTKSPLNPFDKEDRATFSIKYFF